jgi:hypothetical protein
MSLAANSRPFLLFLKVIYVVDAGNYLAVDVGIRIRIQCRRRTDPSPLGRRSDCRGREPAFGTTSDLAVNEGVVLGQLDRGAGRRAIDAGTLLCAGLDAVVRGSPDPAPALTAGLLIAESETCGRSCVTVGRPCHNRGRTCPSSAANRIMCRCESTRLFFSVLGGLRSSEAC